MAIVAHGLGQPEDGALVAGGLGITGADPNALRAVLRGESSLTATLTNGTAPPEPTPPVGSPGVFPWVIPVLYQRPARPGALVAHLHGSSQVTASLDFTLDPDHLAHELATALLLDLV